MSRFKKELQGASNSIKRKIQAIAKSDTSSQNYYVTGGSYDGSDEELDFVGTAGFQSFSVDVSGLVSSSPLTTKGDIFVYGSSNTRLPVGGNGKILKADSTTSTGLVWDDGGTIGGSITDNQVAVGASTANSIEGSSNLTFDGVI